MFPVNVFPVNIFAPSLFGPGSTSAVIPPVVNPDLGTGVPIFSEGGPFPDNVFPRNVFSNSLYPPGEITEVVEDVDPEACEGGPFPASMFSPNVFAGQVFPPECAPPDENLGPNHGTKCLGECGPVWVGERDTAWLICEVRDRFMGPASYDIGTDEATILRRANSVQTEIVAKTLSAYQGFLEVREALTERPEGGIAIPRRAWNSQIRRLLQDDTHIPLRPDRWRISGDLIYLDGCKSNLSMIYFFRPSKLVGPTEWRYVECVDYDRSIITLNDPAPPSWKATQVFDFQAREHSHQPRYWDRRGVVNGDKLVMHDELKGAERWRSAVEPGDYVTRAGYAACPMVPEGMVEALVAGVVYRTAHAMGDDRSAEYKAQYVESVALMQRDLEKRYEGQKPIINRSSRFRQGGYGGRRRRR